MIPAIVFAVALQASLAAQSRENHCDNQQNQFEMNACAGIDFARADVELNAVWRMAVASAREVDREFKAFPGHDDRAGSESVLRNAQRAWLTFRDAHCTFEGYEARGGSMEPMLYNGCRARITRERIAQLRPAPGER
ncbi:MAG: lysozyme inhibitor LprI family protein [Allosphingosinicella sp.]